MATSGRVITSFICMAFLGHFQGSSATVPTRFDYVPSVHLDNVPVVRHEFLDMELPPFVAQGYSRRLMQAASRGEVTADAAVPHPRKAAPKPGPAKPAPAAAKPAPAPVPAPAKPAKPAPASVPTKPTPAPAPAPTKPAPAPTKPAPAPKNPSSDPTSPKEPTATIAPTPPIAKPYKPSGKYPFIVTIGYNKGNHVRIPRKSQFKDTTPWFDIALDVLRKAKGGELHIEAGEYHLKYQFEIRSSNTLVKGAGMTETTLKLADYAPGPWKGAGFLRWINKHNITVTDLTLDGNKDKQHDGYEVGYGRYGIYMHGYKNAVFLRVRTQNFQRYGFDPHGQKSKGVFLWSHGLTVIDCVSKDNNWDGFTFDQTNNIYCKGNYAEGNGRHGFNIITGSKGVIVKNNTAVNNGRLPPEISHGGEGCGFMTDNFDDEKHTKFPGDTRDVLYRDNTVYGADVGGFCAKAVINFTMTHNTITDAKACMVFMLGTVKSTFKDNVCIKTPGKIEYRLTQELDNTVANITYV